jgi:IS30 family transposase
MYRRAAWRRLSLVDRQVIYRRVARGDMHTAIAIDLGCCRKSVQRLLSLSGGLPPREASRSSDRLSLAEREEISRSLQRGESRRAIARRLNRAPSTISREVLANGGRRGYRAWHAERRAILYGYRPKVSKLAANGPLRDAVERRLTQRWSPEQIAQRLRLDYPDDLTMQVSHETIYQSLFVQARGALRHELTALLRTTRRQRRSHQRGMQRGSLPAMVPIRERPAEAADRAVPGHWEGDLSLGRAGRSAIGTVVERRSRYVMLLHLPDGRNAALVRQALADRMTTLPDALRRTLTWDQGKEMAGHVQFRVDTGIPVYFCDPHSPWQRPTNENTNGLLRQYFPRTADLASYTQDQLDAVARELNARPRRTLAWHNPAEVFAQTVATTT